MSRSRGQALLEAALATPILLLIILGGLMFGLVILERIELTHAAQEGAVAGAMNPADSCGVALAVARHIHAVHDEECDVSGQYIEVTLSHQMPMLVPLWADGLTVRVTERALLR